MHRQPGKGEPEHDRLWVGFNLLSHNSFSICSSGNNESASIMVLGYAPPPTFESPRRSVA
jgi:hypothetical protein